QPTLRESDFAEHDRLLGRRERREGDREETRSPACSRIGSNLANPYSKEILDVAMLLCQYDACSDSPSPSTGHSVASPLRGPTDSRGTKDSLAIDPRVGHELRIANA